MGLDLDLEQNRIVSLTVGTKQAEIEMERVEEFVMAPEVIGVPHCPREAAGMMEYRGTLIALFTPGGEPWKPGAGMGCTAVIKKEDGGFYGILAEEIC